MIIKNLREDENGNFVRVEIWRDERTGKFIRIKRVTFGRMVLRSDVYAAEDPQGFEEALNLELDALKEYARTEAKLTASNRAFVRTYYEEPRGELMARFFQKSGKKSGQM